ncbi:Immunoglobulin-like domain of spore germination [Arthrobacter sp. P2b]|nr:Immunoglobulin-like domain of spore germination [Arthrobacter sp. P2b]
MLEIQLQLEHQAARGSALHARKGQATKVPETAAPKGAARALGRARALVLAGVLVAVPALTGCIAEAGPSPTATPLTGPAASGTAQPPSTSAPLETTQSSNKAPVYWIGRSDSGVFLYREFRDVPDQENPVTRALRAMMSDKPLDPDFFTPWQNPSQLATSISGKDVITVDVSEDAFNSNLDADMAARAIQQLVYTATAAAASSGLIDSGQQIRVRILVDGHTDYVAFDHIQLGALMTRTAGLVAPVWIIDPQENVEVGGGSVKITGRNTTAGGKLRWQILQSRDNGAKEPFLTGETTASAEQGQAGVFTLALNLPPGDYELRVSQAGTGDQPDQYEDTRAFKVW